MHAVYRVVLPPVLPRWFNRNEPRVPRHRVDEVQIGVHREGAAAGVEAGEVVEQLTFGMKTFMDELVPR